MTWEIETHSASLDQENYPDHTNILFSYETLNSAILDSGAPKTVCGDKWIEHYIDTLSPRDKEKIVYGQSRNVYRFGCGSKCPAKKEIKFPAVIGNVKVTLRADVVTGDLPLLLSRSCMKQAKTYLNFKDDTIEILGQTRNLSITQSGLYALPLGRNRQAMVDEEIALNTLWFTACDYETPTEIYVSNETVVGAQEHSSKARSHTTDNTGGVKGNQTSQFEDINGEDDVGLQLNNNVAVNPNAANAPVPQNVQVNNYVDVNQNATKPPILENIQGEDKSAAEAHDTEVTDVQEVDGNCHESDDSEDVSDGGSESVEEHTKRTQKKKPGRPPNHRKNQGSHEKREVLKPGNTVRYKMADYKRLLADYKIS